MRCTVLSFAIVTLYFAASIQAAPVPEGPTAGGIGNIAGDIDTGTLKNVAEKALGSGGAQLQEGAIGNIGGSERRDLLPKTPVDDTAQNVGPSALQASIKRDETVPKQEEGVARKRSGTQLSRRSGALGLKKRQEEEEEGGSQKKPPQGPGGKTTDAVAEALAPVTGLSAKTKPAEKSIGQTISLPSTVLSTGTGLVPTDKDVNKQLGDLGTKVDGITGIDKLQQKPGQGKQGGQQQQPPPPQED